MNGGIGLGFPLAIRVLQTPIPFDDGRRFGVVGVVGGGHGGSEQGRGVGRRGSRGL